MTSGSAALLRCVGGHASCRLRAMSRRWAARRLLSRLLGFVRDMGIAAVLGAGVISDAFFAALQITNLVPPAAGRRRAQCRLRADVAAHQAGEGERGACRFFDERVRAPMRARRRRAHADRALVRARRDRPARARLRRRAACLGAVTICTSPIALCRARRGGRRRCRDSQCGRPRRRRRAGHRGIQRRAARRSWLGSPSSGPLHSRHPATHPVLCHRRSPGSRSWLVIGVARFVAL